ncbi:Septum site-determining protein DivIVA [compost metagenome]
MPLTPLDIHNKEFSRRIRGYDEDEVNEFLDQVIKDYEIVIRENKELQNQMLSMQEKLDHFSNIEETLSKTIIVAQEAADEVKNNAKKEAQLIVKEAEKNADRIVNESLSKSRKIAMEVEELKKQASIYRARFRTLVEAQLDLLSQDGWDSLDSREPSLDHGRDRDREIKEIY